MSCISVALMAQYLNVRQRKLGTIIIQHDLFVITDRLDSSINHLKTHSY
jgi:hypothetical protein